MAQNEADQLAAVAQDAIVMPGRRDGGAQHRRTRRIHLLRDDIVKSAR
jgi:hypothetical protein